MDTLTFIADVIKSLAWPVTVLAVFLIFRKPLMRLVPLLQHLRYGDLELDFGRRVSELASDVARELPASLRSEQAGPVSQYFERLARLSPRAVVLEAWLQLEEAAVQAARSAGLQLSSAEQRSPLLLGQALEQAGILDPPKQSIFYRLRNLRNAATHAADFVFEPDAAQEYAESALRLAEFIRSRAKDRSPS